MGRGRSKQIDRTPPLPLPPPQTICFSYTQSEEEDQSRSIVHSSLPPPQTICFSYTQWEEEDQSRSIVHSPPPSPAPRRRPYVLATPSGKRKIKADRLCTPPLPPPQTICFSYTQWEEEDQSRSIVHSPPCRRPYVLATPSGKRKIKADRLCTPPLPQTICFSYTQWEEEDQSRSIVHSPPPSPAPHRRPYVLATPSGKRRIKADRLCTPPPATDHMF